MRNLIAVLVAVFAPIAATRSHAADLPKRPHIVFVLADDLGVGDLGCYGGKIAPTPQLDGMARDGVRFTQYYAAVPVCSPSRCGLITGQFPGRWRIHTFLQTVAGNEAREQANFLDAKAPSLPRLLKNAGYKTAHFGKWHLGGGRDVVKPPKFAAYGYDEAAGTWESPEPHPDVTAANWVWSDKDKVKRWQRSAFFVDRTLDFLKRNKETPCFVNVWLDDPHTPWVPNSTAAPKSERKEDLQAVLSENDRQIGRLRAGLKEMGIEGSTLVIFASDNGPLPTFQGERTVGQRGSKLSLYEGGIREPLIACWPGVIPSGALNTTTVITGVDMLPTLCRVASTDLPVSSHPDGEDLSTALLGISKAERNRPVFWEYGRNAEYASPPRPRDRSPSLAVREGKWKLLVNADGTGAELYDVLADDKETQNVAADHPDVAEQLTKLTLTWRRSLP